MEWIESHIVQLFAVIGLLYAAARGIVALTPTPKDDVVLSKVGMLLRRLARTFGLDFHQGRQANNHSKTVAVILLSCCLSLLIGCTTIQDLRKDPKAEYIAAANIFDATVRSLTVLRVEDKFDDDQIQKISNLIYKGRDLLLTWEAALDAGERPAEVITAVNTVNTELIEIELSTQ